MKRDEETTSYAKMGMAALMPGMIHLLEMMQAEVERFQAAIQGLEQPAGKKKLGRPPGSPNKAAKPDDPDVFRSGWPADPEERKAEMRRRVEKRKARATAAGGAVNPQKKAWNRQSEEEKAARVAKMLAGRKKAQENAA